jgi:hypothetical protein
MNENIDSRLTNNPKQKWNIVFGIFIVIIFSFVLFKQSKLDTDEYNEVYVSSYEGKVLKKNFRREFNHIREMNLLLEDGTLIDVYINCFDSVAIGDSIVKNEDSFEFLIYKKNSLSVIKVDIEENFKQ